MSAASLGAVEALGLAILLSARCVLAEPQDTKAPPAPPAESGQLDAEQVVKDLMRRGVVEYRKGHLEAARAAFERAFVLKQHVAISATLAEVETKLALYRPAAAHWAFYLEHLPREREGERKEAETALAECRRHLGAIRVEVDAPMVKVTLDDEPIETSPLDAIWVEPGDHTLLAEGERGSDRVVVSVAAGESKTAVLHTLTPANSDPAPRGTAATSPTAVAGRASGSEQQRHGEAGTGARTAVLIAGGTAAVVAGIVGTTFAVLSNRAGNSVAQINQELDQAAAEHMLPASGVCALPSPPLGCAELAQKQAEQERNKKIATGSFITAGGLAVLTVGAYLLWPSPNKAKASKAARRWAVAPWFSPTGAGIVLSLPHAS